LDNFIVTLSWLDFSQKYCVSSLCCDTFTLSVEKLAVLHPTPLSNLTAGRGVWKCGYEKPQTGRSGSETSSLLVAVFYRVDV
jgi:hypothetical protein